MAFDGITIRFLTKELEETILGGRIDKIYQVEPDEMLLTIRTPDQTMKLLLSASPSHARFQLTEKKYETPLDPPLFCMVMRKHFQNSRITGIKQIHFDRIVVIEVETRNDFGDLVTRKIVLEMMGKHSNLMLLDEDDRILDAIRHVTNKMSSVRTVMPGLTYVLPTHNTKLDPTEGAKEEAVFDLWMKGASGAVESGLVERIQGLSPSLAREIIYRSGIEGKDLYSHLCDEEKHRLFLSFACLMAEVTEKTASSETTCNTMSESRTREDMYSIKEIPSPMKRPCPDDGKTNASAFQIYRDITGKNVDFSAVPYKMMEGAGITTVPFASLSALMDVYYEKTDTVDKMRQKSQDLRHFLNTNLDRVGKKLQLQKKQMEDTKDRDKDKLFGDLITANLYQIKDGTSRAELINYYEESMPVVSVRLDPRLTASQNAQKYYARYNKLKRTEEALTERIAETEEEREYLESMMNALSLADCEQDLEDIREELRQTGYLKKISQKTRAKKNLKKSEPLRFVTSEGIEGRIGKNNLQNDQLTFKMATERDEWFHVKDMPGSHVILKIDTLVKGRDYTDQSLLEAAAMAALHSRGAADTAVLVDHTKRMYVKKPQGARPGFVIYTHQETIVVKAELIENAKKSFA